MENAWLVKYISIERFVHKNSINLNAFKESCKTNHQKVLRGVEALVCFYDMHTNVTSNFLICIIITVMT